MLTLIFRVFSLFIFALNLQAHQNDFALKTGFIVANSAYNKIDQDDEDFKTEEKSSGLGIFTSFGYTWNRVEFGLESRLTMGKEAKLSFSSQGQKAQGVGSIMTVDISPFTKLHSKTFHFPKKLTNYFESLNLSPWYLYFKVGPSWQIQSINLDDFEIEGFDNQDLKVTYESIGFSISFGIEEDLANKNLHPCFFEVNVSAYESYKVSLVDRSDRAAINILTERDAKQDIVTYQLMFIFGLTLF